MSAHRGFPATALATVRTRFRSAARALSLAVSLGSALAVLSALAAGAHAADEPPRPKAGIVPLELGQVARASGDQLRISDPEMTLAGKRVRFVGKIAEISATADGQQVVVLSDGGDRITLRLPGLIEDPERLDRSEEWEVIVRLLRALTLADGRAAFAVAPDALIKTPGPPSDVRPSDVIARIRGAQSFVDPKLAGFEEEEPLYRSRVLKPGYKEEFTRPGAVALAYVTDEQGRRFLEYRSVMHAADGRQLGVRCQFRIDAGALRNVAYGDVELSPSGERLREDWVDFEEQTFHDKWSARQRSFAVNTYAAPCLSLAMSGFPFGEARVVRFQLWGDNKMTIPLYAYVDGEETIDVRGRPERAYRVKIGFDVRELAAKAIDVPEIWRQYAEAGAEVWFAGESDYWIAAEAPHVVLRFQGPLGGPGAPEVSIDRVR